MRTRAFPLCAVSLVGLVNLQACGSGDAPAGPDAAVADARTDAPVSDMPEDLYVGSDFGREGGGEDPDAEVDGGGDDRDAEMDDGGEDASDLWTAMDLDVRPDLGDEAGPMPGDMMPDVSVPGDAPMCASMTCGDVDQDGRVNVRDVTHLRGLVGAPRVSECEAFYGDVDGDGTLTLRDVRGVGQLIAFATGGCAERCSAVCGDLDNDGRLSAEDLRAFESPALLQPVCARLDGDVIQDNTLNELDQRAIARMLTAGVLGGPRLVQTCEPCAVLCGDANVDGRVNILDVTTIRTWSSGSPEVPACGFANGDVNGDGRFSDADLLVLRGLLLFQVDRACTACRDRRCGDLDGDGMMTERDVERLREIVAGGRMVDGCTYAVADLNGDLDVDAADVARLAEIVEAGSGGGACPR